MQNEKTITFVKLPEAVGYLSEQVIELKKMVSELKPSPSEKRVLIEIEDACRIIHKAKATIYATDGRKLRNRIMTRSGKYAKWNAPQT